MSSGTPLLILASTSPYRRGLLSRLVAGFRVESPQIDETPDEGETPSALAERLARAKALAVASRNLGAVVIGSDQVAEIDGRALGKPGNAERARAQLAASSGRTVVFHTALCVVDGPSWPVREFAHIDRTRVVFRTLGGEEIARYVEHENPLDCAGSFKAEGLGIALFERIETVDPTALIGLPLIALAGLLRRAGFTLP